MNNDLGTYELIQLYLKGKLSGEKLRGFEKRLLEETDFKNYVENHQTADLLIKRKELNSIKNELQKIHEENIQPGGSWKWFSVILIGLVLVFLSWNYFDFNKNKRENIEANESIAVIESGDLEKIVDSDLSAKGDMNKQILSVSGNKDRASEYKGNRIEDESIRTEKQIERTMADMEKKNISNESLKGTEKPTILSPLKNEKSNKTSGKKEFKSVDCEPFEVSLEVEIYSTCSGKNDGVLKINNEEFSSDYRYIIDQSPPRKDRVYTQLSMGEHEVLVVDERGCKSDPIFVNVTERNCDIIISKSQSVFWEIPVEFTRDNDALLEVYSAKSGRLVYSKRLRVNEAHTWKGRDSNDNYLPMGSYVYNISIDGTHVAGEISVLD